MSNTLANASKDELLRIGEAICRGRDWRWVAMWTCNVHRLFRPRMEPREIWNKLDALIQSEWDWHIGQDLFQEIRKVALAAEKEQSAAERQYLQLGEITAKSISNASWRPGLFDFNAPLQVPLLAIQIARHLGDEKQLDFLHHHFTSLAKNRYADKPEKS
jgi:hypothetical protein